MHTTLRNAGITAATTVAAAAVALSTATGAGAASSAVIIGGISVPKMSDLLMAPLLGGAFKNQERINVQWPAEAGPFTGRGDLTLGASIAVGKENMHAAIKDALANLDRDAAGNIVAGQKVTVVGLSAGALVVDEVMRDLAGTPGAPSAEHLTFVVAADSSRQNMINKSSRNDRYDYTYQPAPATGYDVVVVTGEYDGMADFPDRPWNLLAMVNAIAGGIVVHVPSTYADLTKVPTSNITVETNAQGGTTTHYLVPTKKLPIVTLLPFLAPREAELKAKIDKAYIRNDVKTTTTAAKTADARTAISSVPATVARTLAVDTEATAVQSEANVESKAEVAAKAKAKAEVEVDTKAQAKAEAKQSRAEAKQARAEARQAKADARAEAKKAKADARAEAKKAKADAKQATAGTKNVGSSDSTDSSE
ncbi:PE-PPE domain-containing protein [Mycobacterium sp. SMC-4]|uniref:PE-PPE domain-containing protein n=1 Tax=Mycobacterium sp. SMC-4 TaxID=2857059 RepID=UPI003CFF4AFC